MKKNQKCSKQIFPLKHHLLFYPQLLNKNSRINIFSPNKLSQLVGLPREGFLWWWCVPKEAGKKGKDSCGGDVFHPSFLILDSLRLLFHPQRLLVLQFQTFYNFHFEVDLLIIKLKNFKFKTWQFPPFPFVTMKVWLFCFLSFWCISFIIPLSKPSLTKCIYFLGILKKNGVNMLSFLKVYLYLFVFLMNDNDNEDVR
jgi:hypothetical protein